MPLLDPEITAKLGTLQSLDDAIAYRSSRLDMPCPDCTRQRLSGQRCTEHTCDIGLLEDYQERYLQEFHEAVTGMDPADLDKVLTPGDDRPAPSDLLALSITAHLRKLAADRPVLTRLTGRPAVIEMQGHRIIEHPLTSTGHSHLPDIIA